MGEIIPAINTTSFEEVKEKIQKVEAHAKWVHIDVADGTFTQNSLWNNPEELKSIQSKVNIEVHLMITNPEKVIDRLITAGVKRIIVHVETVQNFDEIKKKCDTAGVSLMLSLAPDTDVSALEPYFEKISSFQVLSVHPGLAGQLFIESSYDKIRSIRDKCLTCDIEVDGGVKVGIAKKCKEAGANLFVAASAIYGEENISQAIQILREDINQ